MLLFVVFKMFKKGLTHRSRTKEMNKVIIFEIFHKIIEEHSYNQVKMCLLERNRLFDRNIHDYVHFEKKVREWLSSNLGVEISEDLFLVSKNMNDLLNNIADCKRRFLIPAAICSKYNFNKEWSKAGSGVSRLIYLIRGFISNIPSDRDILGITED